MTPQEFVATIKGNQLFLRKQAGGVRADLTGENLSGLRRPNLNLRDAILTDADFRGAVVTGCNFRNAELRGAKFQGADAEETDFGIADLRGSHFQDAKLAGANFKGADPPAPADHPNRRDWKQHRPGSDHGQTWGPGRCHGRFP